MKRIARLVLDRTSPSMVVAIVAVVVTMTAGAVAATRPASRLPSGLMWINPLDLLPGDPSVHTSFNAVNSRVGSGLSGLIVTSSTTGDIAPGGGNKVIEPVSTSRPVTASPASRVLPGERRDDVPRPDPARPGPEPARDRKHRARRRDPPAHAGPGVRGQHAGFANRRFDRRQRRRPAPLPPPQLRQHLGSVRAARASAEVGAGLTESAP